VRGYQPQTAQAWDYAKLTFPDNDLGERTAAPVAALEEAEKLPAGSMLIMLNSHRLFRMEEQTVLMVLQGLLNLRDAYASTARSVVMVGSSPTLPEELAQDVVVIEDPLPSEDERRTMLSDLASRSGATAGDLAVGVDAITGLGRFASEQVAALSLRQAGYDVGQLWERTKQTLNAMKGMSVQRDDLTFDKIGGCDNIKGFLVRLLNGASPPRVILFLDEIEKMFGGLAGDSSGVSQRLLGLMLSWMEDMRIAGMIFIGPPGAAKTAVAKSAASHIGVPCVEFHLSKMLGQYVGNSEEALTSAINVVNAVSEGRVLCIATCNSITVLPPELRRRFKLGTFFFDLPTAEERAAIWPIHLAAFGLPSNMERPNDEGWTGAEIRNCCEVAWRLGTSLTEAAGFIVPVAISASKQIEALRNSADGRYISANRTGVYRKQQVASSDQTPGVVVDLSEFD